MMIIDTAAIVAQIAEERAAAKELIEKEHHLSQPLANAVDRYEKAANGLLNARNEIYAGSHRANMAFEKRIIAGYAERITNNEGITR